MVENSIFLVSKPRSYIHLVHHFQLQHILSPLEFPLVSSYDSWLKQQGLKKKKKKEDPDHLIKVINIPGNMAQKAIKGNPISKPC